MGTPETCPKSSLVRYRFVEGKWANMSPKEAFDWYEFTQINAV